ncbi:hypothetical protein [Solibacillus daqui]|uniref:hypothetical protein n=1 Tax=Solibacillus daqui TaxID=2912187 RepID=UPI0023651F5D|nr:hypothetical protein [Solibacillus daqui]
MNKRLFLFWIVVVLSFSVNIIPSFKYPDSNITIIHFLFSCVVILALLLLTYKQLKMVLYISGITGVLIYCINLSVVSKARIDNSLLDILLSIEYPLYAIIVTPLFGINFLFSTDYAHFALGIATISGVILLLLVLLRREKRLKTRRFIDLTKLSKKVT